MGGDKGTEWEFCSSYIHNTVNLVERINQAIWNKVSKSSLFGEKSWKRAVKQTIRAINISYCRAVDASPYVAQFGERAKKGH